MDTPTPSPQPLAAKRVSRQRLYEHLVEQIVEMIRDAGLTVGSLLPAERELAQAFGVSRATLSQALVALEVLGIVSVEHGTGAVVTQVPMQGILPRFRAHRERLPDIIEARLAIEPQLAALAAERATAEDIAAIDAAIEFMADEVASGRRGQEGDSRFHAAVAGAARSPVLAGLLASMEQLVHETRVESLGQPGRPAASLEGHRKIATAIGGSEPKAARQAMIDHIAAVSQIALTAEDAR